MKEVRLIFGLPSVGQCVRTLPCGKVETYLFQKVADELWFLFVRGRAKYVDIEFHDGKKVQYLGMYYPEMCTDTVGEFKFRESPKLGLVAVQ